MSLDEVPLREWVHRVIHGMADQRAFLRYMMGLGLSGPFLSQLLAPSTPAQAQTPRPVADFVPIKHCRSVNGGWARRSWLNRPSPF